MEMSIREAKAKFSEAIAAAERGERVSVTKHGRVVAEIGPPAKKKGGLDFEAIDRYRKAKGWDKLDLKLPENFDDPAFSRQVLGLEE